MQSLNPYILMNLCGCFLREGLRRLVGSVVVLSVLHIFSLAQAGAPAQVSPAWGDLRAGEYAVGFQAVNRYDYSRTYETKSRPEELARSGERARPMQIWIWYPAKKTGSDSYMSYKEYVYLSATEEKGGAPTAEARAASRRIFTAHPVFQNVPPDRMDQLFKMRTAASKNAAPHAGHFPLVVFGQGYFFESPLTHSILCEYLASHGYVVAAVPYQGYPLPQSFHDLVGLENETRDMEYVISFMHDFPNADHDRLGVIGFDYGGMAALLVQMRNTDVDAVVGIDTGIMFLHNSVLLKQSPSYKVTNLRVPLMLVTRTQAENGPEEDLSLFEQAKYSERFLLRLKGMNHQDFTSFGMLLSTLLDAGDTSRRGKRMEYETTCRYVLNFLDAYVKRSGRVLSYIENRSDTEGLPEGFLTLERRRGVKAPPSEREFVELILKEGSGRAAEVYGEVKRTDHGYVLFREEILNALGYRLIQEGRIKEAVEIFRLNAEAYPQSWNAYDSLGEAYMRAGEKEQAIKNYRKSLELNPQNTNAAEMLKKLTAQ